jgi:hypothetical protein
MAHSEGPEFKPHYCQKKNATGKKQELFAQLVYTQQGSTFIINYLHTLLLSYCPSHSLTILFFSTIIQYTVVFCFDGTGI